MKRHLLFLTVLFSLVFQGIQIYGGEQPGFLGTSLPAGFRPFSPDSPWNTPIPPNPQIDKFSKDMIGHLKKTAGELRGNLVKWTIPLFVVDSKKSPKVDVLTIAEHLDPNVDPKGSGIAAGLPIPDGVWPDPEADGHMLLVDPVAMKSWDFSRARRLSDNKWVASTISVWDLKGAGYRTPFKGQYWWTYGSRGSGFPLIAGLIRPEEIEAGEIKHALVFATPINRKSLVPAGQAELCSPPASRTDGTEDGPQFIPEGARMQLDPFLDLNTLNLSPATKVIAHAMQKYGMYNGDNAGRFVIYFQNLGDSSNVWGRYNYFSDLKNIPLDKFRVLQCSTVTRTQQP
ncbi:MAG: hypothetical protein HQL06_14385 [Nitrospirae bacterium]|nr:hypothetical protein [Nitrospirota bacterium]